MKKRFQVTLLDIAKQVDVSKVTVSKALRGHPDISPETAKKIKKVTENLGTSRIIWRGTFHRGRPIR